MHDKTRVVYELMLDREFRTATEIASALGYDDILCLDVNSKPRQECLAAIVQKLSGIANRHGMPIPISGSGIDRKFRFARDGEVMKSPSEPKPKNPSPALFRSPIRLPDMPQEEPTIESDEDDVQYRHRGRVMLRVFMDHPKDVLSLEEICTHVAAIQSDYTEVGKLKKGIYDLKRCGGIVGYDSRDHSAYLEPKYHGMSFDEVYGIYSGGWKARPTTAK